MDSIEKIKKAVNLEKEEYEKQRAEFYSNPLHWDNNKRRFHGLSVLRGKINKNRRKKFRSFIPSHYIFSLIDKVITNRIADDLNKEWLVDYRELL